MSFNESVEIIITHAKNKDETAYEKLTNDSKEELKNYSKTEILESMSNFFHANSFLTIEDEPGDFLNTAEVTLFNPTRKLYYKVMFLREEKEWKIRWNNRAYQENM